VSEEDANDESLEARLRKIAEQLGRSVEDLDVEMLARAAGVEVDRVRALLDDAGQWLSSQADGLASEAALRFGELFSAVTRSQAPEPSTGPHPLDRPTPGQGLALSAIDSGRWTVEPGSHVLLAHGEGPAPADALGLVGELRARDWISADGELTLVGRNALKRWIESSDA
jgi:hypothetical protein